ncbi:MAG: hypothetical protein RIS45_313, partial [Planctomycetota bacterium]
RDGWIDARDIELSRLLSLGDN